MLRHALLLIAAAAALAAPDTQPSSPLADNAPICGIPCASTLLPGGALTLPPASIIARFEATPDAAACCGQCQANAECRSFMWCGDGGACGVPAGAPALFGGAAQKGTCVLASEAPARVGAGGGAVTAGRSAWTAGQKACVTGPKEGGPKTAPPTPKPTAAPPAKPATPQAKPAPPKPGAPQPPPVDDDDDDNDGAPSSLGPGTGRYAGAAVAAANNLPRPGAALPRPGAAAGQQQQPRLPPGLARLAARGGQGPPQPPPEQQPRHGPRHGPLHGPGDEAP